MSDRLDVSPTRGTMLRLRAQLEDIRSRHGLLDRKRRVLIRELMSRLDEASRREQEGRDALGVAHQAMEQARMRMGSDRVDSISLEPTARVNVQLYTRTLMGVRIPRVQTQIDPLALPYGLSDTSAALDEACARWRAVVRWLGAAAEVSAAVWRIATELRKTQRQVNALESTVIPRFEATIAAIEERLEEDEREDLIHASKIKEKKASRPDR
jgi:V/A-type H+-transporting ATPase subunit D